ncbi:hypothetical protein B0T09DRAFT_327755 [Sordaria sp. MPI-SDFR-AT-0083]|nr:hypothetical protein B0T09DRAFT_327755 [Sordaria sp. MPI-SDFR-AT-0083]
MGVMNFSFRFWWRGRAFFVVIRGRSMRLFQPSLQASVLLPLHGDDRKEDHPFRHTWLPYHYYTGIPCRDKHCYSKRTSTSY